MNNIIAPIKSLKSSWISEVFTKPKKSVSIIKRSLSSRPKSLVFYRGSIVKSGTDYSY